MKQLENDEFDLFDLFEALWNDKSIIFFFVAFATLLASGYIFMKKPVYESKLVSSIDKIPPFIKHKEASADFKKIFYSGKIFENWKKVNTNVSIKFEDFSKTKIVDGIILAKHRDNLKISLETKKNNFLIFINSNNLGLINDTFNYTTHINELLKSKYKSESSNFLSQTIIRSDVESNKIQKDYVILFLFQIERGGEIFTINRPTIPVKILPKSSMILSLSIMFGFIFGCLFVFVRNSMRKREEQLKVG